ncbi:TPA: DUF2063 domain-containing protein [Legionella pneumophila subsp. pneumophila]|uniref:HvfC/BufC N-terminal domain-containing protein n=1 Tax=Legionella pneumophila TaxID=446 RepID=UPI00058AF934|nr:DNA-binding domain-containing protein [Legionella pneumophila]MCW8468124.1 DNA-binding domain-containing protein [Legionella pneumophila]MCW8477793.1 DNA-binding domain-containing protein [Legionella pneumophila]HAT8907783.1 DUF2063 domain-containing protein [Legionella pneumophila subsp. pneumophila]
MKSLLTLQAQFQEFIYSGQGSIKESIVPTKLVSTETRLNIYKDGYRLRLIECLAANYPALYAYLGTEEFEKLSARYIDSYPSAYRSIRWYGDRLPELIKKYYAKSCYYLYELAELEWKMTLAFDAADDTVLNVEEMAAVPPESWAEMGFVLHSSVHRLDFCWNVFSLWQALVNNLEIPELKDSPAATGWVLWRGQNYIIQYYSLSEEEAWALDALIQGSSFGAICEGLCQWMPAEEVGMKAASYLKNWIQNGLLSQCRIRRN